MLIWLLVACTNDHYLNHPVPVDPAADTAAEPSTDELICDGPQLQVTPRTVEFTSYVTPLPEEIELRTDTADLTVKNTCSIERNVMLSVDGGDIGNFALITEDGDQEVDNGTFITIPAFTSAVRSMSYTADDGDTGVAYDRGTFTAHVFEGDSAVFQAEAKLDATVINMTF